MVTIWTTGQTVEIEAIVRLAPLAPVSRETLEEATIDVEQVLAQQTLEITGGASASANLQTGSIEIDVALTGETMGELAQKLALIVTRLDHHYESTRLSPPSCDTGLPAWSVRESQMRRLLPERAVS